jgi:hypothetical protein
MSVEPCSLHDGLIDFPEPLASIVDDYKYALQLLQLEILATDPDNLKDIGHCFEKLEKAFNRLIKYTAEKH